MTRRLFTSIIAALPFLRAKPVTALSTAYIEMGHTFYLPAFPSAEEWEHPHLILTETIPIEEFHRRYPEAWKLQQWRNRLLSEQIEAQEVSRELEWERIRKELGS